MKLIDIYDENNERVGSTYPRRAKQLVKTQRASWLEEGKSLLLSSTIEKMLDPPSSTEEDLSMIDSHMNQNHGEHEAEITEPSHETAKYNDLLMLLAKKNVVEKRRLFRHIPAYIIALFVFFIAFSNNTSASHRRHHQYVDIAISYLQASRGSMLKVNLRDENLRNDGLFFHRHYERLLREGVALSTYNAELLEEAIQALAVLSSMLWSATEIDDTVSRYLSEAEMWLNHSTDIPVTYQWYVLGGILLAWGAWIGLCIVKRVHKYLQERPPNLTKPDPVALEYRRLKERTVLK